MSRGRQNDEYLKRHKGGAKSETFRMARESDVTGGINLGEADPGVDSVRRSPWGPVRSGGQVCESPLGHKETSGRV